MIRWICGIKDRDEIPSGSWLQKLGIENITSVLRFQRLSPVSNLSQTFRFPALESKGGLGKHGLMSVSVALLALTHWTEMQGESMFNVVCCCQPIEWDTENGEHFNLKNGSGWMNGWMVIGIYDFIDRPADNVPNMSAWTVWWDTWPLGSIFCFMNIRRLLRVWQYIIRLIRFRELGHTKSQSEFNTAKFSGLDITAIIASKCFLMPWQISLATGVLYATQP